MSVNKVILLGNVGADPEIRYPEKDTAIAYFPLATNERVANSQTEITEWHRIVVHGPGAQYIERYVRKGTRLYLEGSLRTREYTDKLQISRKITEIYAVYFEILGR